ncbi:RNA polymerase sigma factor sigC [Citrus sinensis]|uniref:RNA polymerase sigma factor sigC n=1 Tax=Citrus sinensis TaxID=2711 RepID=A0ACB8NPT9_CITSI|nr:RNA polymerase sigma factor sigC [Citrus sinensis]
MGMGFRLNLKWVSPVQSHFFTTSSCRLSSTSVRGREGSFNSARLSFLSTISEDSASYFQDPVKAYTCSFVNTQTVENDYSETEEIRQKSTSCIGQDASSRSDFRLLMENLDVLESTFADSDALRLEREILQQLGKLGALKLFNSHLSRIVKTSNVLDLSDVHTEEQKMDDSRDYHMGKILVPSKRKGKRKLKTARVSEESIETYLLSLPSEALQEGLKQPTIFSAERALNSRGRRLMIARNEAEMSKGVQVVANLERIKTTLEKESGKAARLNCWAQAAGVSERVLKQHLAFGWYCREELIKSTRPLVLFLARNYRGLGIPFSDLLQAGNVGVLQGAERFDHTRGYKFSTYVQYWIRKSISKMVARHARGIKIPVPLFLIWEISKIQKARKALTNSHGKYPEDIEIAKYTGLSLAEIRSASECLRIVGSIDQKIGDCLNAKYLEFAPDRSVKSPKEIVMRQHMKKDVFRILESLDSRERQVLVLRYGLNDHRPKSLEEIGKLFHVSKEWIRKLEKKAMTKLRDSETCRDLSHFLVL